MKSAPLSAHLGGGDVLAFAQLEREAAHDAGDDRRLGDGDDEDDVERGRAEQRQHDHVEDDHRKGEQDVGDAGDQKVGNTPVVAGDEFEKAADHGGGKYRDRRHRQDAARAPQHAREDVAAEMIGAEKVCCRRRGMRCRQHGGRVRRVGREEWCENCGCDPEQHDRETDERRPRPGKARKRGEPGREPAGPTLGAGGGFVRSCDAFEAHGGVLAQLRIRGSSSI